jgi:hypothetical protein
VGCALGLGAAPAHTEADYAAHIQKLKARLPVGFALVEQRPFVVVGDEAPSVVKQRAESTVKWAVDLLKKDFFARDPEDIIDVWLFKNKASYEKHTAQLFQDKPDTPFGYYSPAHKALVMNIETGGGTLVHEIVHPFMRANFPACPAWFNEGMGSLYEQCHEANGHITGLTNWRLPILQKAIANKTTIAFSKLLAMDDSQFYNDRGAHYAQARYLCYYLQQKGLLVKFYREFTANHEQDPTGVATLQKVLGEKDLTKFQPMWETFALGLKFP